MALTDGRIAKPGDCRRGTPTSLMVTFDSVILQCKRIMFILSRTPKCQSDGNLGEEFSIKNIIHLDRNNQRLKKDYSDKCRLM